MAIQKEILMGADKVKQGSFIESDYYKILKKISTEPVKGVNPEVEEISGIENYKHHLHVLVCVRAVSGPAKNRYGDGQVYYLTAYGSQLIKMIENYDSDAYKIPGEEYLRMIESGEIQ